MAPHFSTLAWKMPWMEEPGRLQSMGSLRAGHDWATSLSLFTFLHWRRNGNPLRCSCLENPRDGGAWWAAVYGVAQSRTRLKRLSSNSSSSSSKLCVQYLSLETLIWLYRSFALLVCLSSGSETVTVSKKKATFAFPHCFSGSVLFQFWNIKGDI